MKEAHYSDGHGEILQIIKRMPILIGVHLLN